MLENNEKLVITRFPPSPSGFLHLGGARTALFNWLYARKMKGKFVLRIEDTDVQRSTKASVDAIIDSLKWLGIDWDEGPYFQSERLPVYMEFIQKLLDSGNAYYCDCPVDRLEAIRKNALAAGGKPKYDGKCREKGLTKSAETVVRFKAPLMGVTVLDDLVKGHISFQNSELDDFIIARSDGSPTYNFCVVVDDITMGINTIIRGDDHVMNTPKQIQIYNALDSALPVFAHVPMVLGSDRSRLSKRHGAMSVLAYRDMGYLPDALINYLVRLGWSYGDQEFFSRKELIEKFNLENIGKSAGIFNLDKLLSLNAGHIQASSPKDLIPSLDPFLKEKGFPEKPNQYLEAAVHTLIPRSKTLQEMAEGIRFYLTDDISYEAEGIKKFFFAESASILKQVAEEIDRAPLFEEKELENAFKSVMDRTGLKLGKIAQPVRLALTGKIASPGIFEIILILGKECVLQRLGKAVDFIEKRSA
ncbi:MAG: glutamate--tRNA ligase [Thermodesulfobacteriota bacterium]